MEYLTGSAQVWHVLVVLVAVVGLWVWDEYQLSKMDREATSNTNGEDEPVWWGDELVKRLELAKLKDRVDKLESRTWQYKLMRWLRRQ